MFIYLYKITNLVNNKIYLGVHKTDNLDDGYMGSGKLIKLAIHKYGLQNFKKDILEFFDTYTEALDRESKIVSDEFLLREDVYNLRRGGNGGFDYINLHKLSVQNLKNKSTRIKTTESRKSHFLSDKEFANKISEVSRNNISTVHKRGLHKGFLGRFHTDETKNKMSGPRPQSSNKKNSQYGTCWITKDNVNKKISKIDLDVYLSAGWIRGRIL